METTASVSSSREPVICSAAPGEGLRGRDWKVSTEAVRQRVKRPIRWPLSAPTSSVTSVKPKNFKAAKNL